jgi:hypothetical protein
MAVMFLQSTAPSKIRFSAAGQTHQNSLKSHQNDRKNIKKAAEKIKD